MWKVLELPDLSDFAPDDGLLVVELGSEWADLLLLWRMVLAMAVRDGAASVHYHPWRADGHFSYVVAGVRYELIPPPLEEARRFAAAAGALTCGGRLGAASRRWLGWPQRAAGHVRLTGVSGASEWVGVVWSAGSLAGVEWYRLDFCSLDAKPAPAPDPAI